MSTYLILIPILFPILLGCYMLLFPIQKEKTRNIVVESVVIVNSILTLWLIFQGPKGTCTLFSLGEYLPMTLRVDGLAAFFGSLVACLWPLATLYTFEYMHHEERVNTFLACYTITYGVTLGVALAGNIITMYLFYETLTMVTLPLVMHTMTAKAKRAARQYLYYMIGGTAFAFIGMVFYALYSTNLEFTFGGCLNLERIARHGNVVLLIYVLAFFGFGVKAAVFPFHRWLPSASVAPTPVTALLHAVAVVKSGVFAILRLTCYCFGMEYIRGTWAQAVVMIVSMITIAYASTIGVRETHLKRRLAYSTVSNLSYILLGLSTMTPLGFLAGMAHMLFHAVMKISGFFCVGAIMHQTDRNYIYEIDGLAYRMPLTFTALLISSLSLAGFPLFSGFISKWRLATALFSEGGSLGRAGVLVLIYSALMTAIYMLAIVIRMLFPHQGYDVETVRTFRDPTWEMTVPLMLFTVVTIGFGLYAQPVLSWLWPIALGQW